jgi:hypothetical protein
MKRPRSHARWPGSALLLGLAATAAPARLNAEPQPAALRTPARPAASEKAAVTTHAAVPAPAPARPAPPANDAPAPEAAEAAPAARAVAPPDLTKLRAEYDRLREELFKARVRSQKVSETVFPSKMDVRLHWKGGPDFVIRKARMLLDGAELWD